MKFATESFFYYKTAFQSDYSFFKPIYDFQNLVQASCCCRFHFNTQVAHMANLQTIFMAFTLHNNFYYILIAEWHLSHPRIYKLPKQNITGTHGPLVIRTPRANPPDICSIGGGSPCRGPWAWRRWSGPPLARSASCSRSTWEQTFCGENSKYELLNNRISWQKWLES